MRNRLHTRRELLKALLAAPGAAMFAEIGFPSIAMASQESKIKTVVDTDLADQIVVSPNRAVTSIKVVGVGGAGTSAIDLMIHEGLQGVEFVCVDTDGQKLRGSNAKTKILLGNDCGATGKPAIARDLATASRTRIARVLHGADLVFVVAGLGGGTGTGAAPIVAKVAREMGSLTAAIVTTPFDSEGQRMDVALIGAGQLNAITDALILVPLERFASNFGCETLLSGVPRFADRQIGYAIKGLVDNLDVNLTDTITLDLEDLQWGLKGSGLSATGSATARGNDRARLATMEALYFPSMMVLRPDQRRLIIFNIASSRQPRMPVIEEVFRTVRKNVSEKTTIFGSATFDDGLKDHLRVTLVALGQGDSDIPDYRTRGQHGSS